MTTSRGLDELDAEAALAHVAGGETEARVSARRSPRKAPPADGEVGRVLEKSTGGKT